MTIEKYLEEMSISEEVKKGLKEAFDKQVQEAVDAKEAELKSEFIEEKSKLNENVMKMVEEAVAEEMASVEDELVEARNLDVKYAKQLTEFKERYAEVMTEKLQEEVNRKVENEIVDLRESLEEATKNRWGSKVFEAFKDEFSEYFGAEQKDAEELKSKLDEAYGELEKYARKEKINSLLEGYTGKNRSVIESILSSVPTDRLEEKFDSVSKVVLKEGDEQEEQISESEKEKEGNVVLETDTGETKVDEKWLNEIKRRAGIKRK